MVPGPALLTGEPVPPFHIGLHVVKSPLLSVLIVSPLYLRVHNSLRIKPPSLKCNLLNREKSCHLQTDSPDAVHLVPYGRCKPSLLLRRRAVVKPCCTVSRFSEPSAGSQSPSLGKSPGDVVPEKYLGGEQFPPVRSNAHTHMARPEVDAHGAFLPVA